MSERLAFKIRWALIAGRRRISGERGASLVEYALLVALIAIVCIAAVTFLGGQTNSSINHSGSTLFP